MFTDQITLRPRYGEVDRMGYVYHANFVVYCHQARTELMRRLGIEDRKLEEEKILLPVIEMQLTHKKPAYYDDLLTIVTTITKLRETKLYFEFTIQNEQQELVCAAKTTVAFVHAETRKPLRMPQLIKNALSVHFKLFNP